MHDRKNEQGYALLTVTVMSAFLMTTLAAYFFLSGSARSTARSTMDSTRGYYAAEAGVNLRLDALRTTFLGYNRPAGSSPDDVAGQLPCTGGDQGSGDYQCNEIPFAERNVRSFVREDVANPQAIVIPRGEIYQNLRAQEYGYDVDAVAVGAGDHAEALVNVHVRARLVPLFQFAAFYNKDLEILPGPAMSFEGPVHTNGSLYLDAGDSLTINGQVTAAGKIYRGRKEDGTCTGSPVNVYDPATPRELPHGAGTREEVLNSEVAVWNGMVQSGVDIVDVPAPDALDPTPGSLYWDNADLRIVLDVSGSPTVEVRDATGAVDAVATAALDACAGAVDRSTSFYNFRESTGIEMMEVDLLAVLNCAHAAPALLDGSTIDDSTHGGLVVHLSVDGPDSATINDYGVRVSNAAELGSNAAMAPEIRGLTLVTDQALYLQGDFNAVDKKPSAVLADSLNILSGNFDDSHASHALDHRMATSTVINAAFLAGTDTTGGAEGVAGQDGGNYNGGLENYPRFHEDWSGATLTYRGSFVSLGEARHVDGPWSAQSYAPPTRNWGFETDFNDAALLPPLTPRFVYLVQDLFVRDFEL